MIGLHRHKRATCLSKHKNPRIHVLKFINNTDVYKVEEAEHDFKLDAMAYSRDISRGFRATRMIADFRRALYGK